METIKLFDGFSLVYEDSNGRLQKEDFDNLQDIFRAFRWDEQDVATQRAIDAVVMELFCCGKIDLSTACRGRTCIIQAIPAED